MTGLCHATTLLFKDSASGHPVKSRQQQQQQNLTVNIISAQVRKFRIVSPEVGADLGVNSRGGSFDETNEKNQVTLNAIKLSNSAAWWQKMTKNCQQLEKLSLNIGIRIPWVLGRAGRGDGVRHIILVASLRKVWQDCCLQWPACLMQIKRKKCLIYSYLFILILLASNLFYVHNEGNRNQ